VFVQKEERHGPGYRPLEEKVEPDVFESETLVE
jgi:hypothetical protein